MLVRMRGQYRLLAVSTIRGKMGCLHLRGTWSRAHFISRIYFLDLKRFRIWKPRANRSGQFCLSDLKEACDITSRADGGTPFCLWSYSQPIDSKPSDSGFKGPWRGSSGRLNTSRSARRWQRLFSVLASHFYISQPNFKNLHTVVFHFKAAHFKAGFQGNRRILSSQNFPL
jgi:hypothetical protein